MVLNILGYKFVSLQGEVKGKIKGLTKTLSWIKKKEITRRNMRRWVEGLEDLKANEKVTRPGFGVLPYSCLPGKGKFFLSGCRGLSGLGD